MPTSRGRKKPTKSSPPPNPPKSQPWWIRYWKIIVATPIATYVGLAAAVTTFLPRVQFEPSVEYVAGSPFPASVRISNQLWPLKRVSFAVRICHTENDVGGKVIGMKDCTGASKGAGDITTPSWQHHRLAMDEKWDIPIGGYLAFTVDARTADVRLVLKYWPWLVPKLPFVDLLEKEARLVLYSKPDGTHFWGAHPID
jgi:hypothetical protein